jgi:hypothetical protein
MMHVQRRRDRGMKEGRRRKQGGRKGEREREKKQFEVF